MGAFINGLGGFLSGTTTMFSSGYSFSDRHISEFLKGAYAQQMQNQSTVWSNAFGSHETPAVERASIKQAAWDKNTKTKSSQVDSAGMAWLRVRVDEIRAVGRQVLV